MFMLHTPDLADKNVGKKFQLLEDYRLDDGLSVVISTSTWIMIEISDSTKGTP